MSEILSKALKFKIASDRGDEHVRKFASEKYNEFLMDNNLEDKDVRDFEKLESKVKNKKEIVVDGKTFSSMEQFIEYYETLTFKRKLIVFCEIFNKKFNAKKNTENKTI